MANRYILYGHFPSPEVSPRDEGAFLDGTTGLLFAKLENPFMAFPPSLVSANYILLQMETDEHLPLRDEL